MQLMNVTKGYGSAVVLNGVSMEIPEGKITCILGKSGAGKTTLLNLLAGVLRADGGVVDAPEKVGYVFQENRLLPHLTVAENLQFVGGRCEVIEKLLRGAGLDALANRRVKTLSGGEKRRVAFLRAFCVDSPVVLLDEPFTALDTVTKESLLALMAELVGGCGKTAVFVTHDVDEAIAIGDKIAVFGGGRIVFETDLPSGEKPRAYGECVEVRERVMKALRECAFADE
jgi:NitT/TauT family transport system ATP-binding protein